MFPLILLRKSMPLTSLIYTRFSVVSVGIALPFSSMYSLLAANSLNCPIVGIIHFGPQLNIAASYSLESGIDVDKDAPFVF